MYTIFIKMRMPYISIANIIFFFESLRKITNFTWTSSKTFSSTRLVYVIFDMNTHETPALWHSWTLSLNWSINFQYLLIWCHSVCRLFQYLKSQYRWCCLDFHLNNVTPVLSSVYKTKQSCITISNLPMLLYLVISFLFLLGYCH